MGGRAWAWGECARGRACGARCIRARAHCFCFKQGPHWAPRSKLCAFRGGLDVCPPARPPAEQNVPGLCSARQAMRLQLLVRANTYSPSRHRSKHFTRIHSGHPQQPRKVMDYYLQFPDEVRHREVKSSSYRPQSLSTSLFLKRESSQTPV